MMALLDADFKVLFICWSILIAPTQYSLKVQNLVGLNVRFYSKLNFFSICFDFSLIGSFQKVLYFLLLPFYL